MLPLLVLITSCAAGELTESSEPDAAVLQAVGADESLPIVVSAKGGGRGKNKSSAGVKAVVVSPATATVQVGATQKFTAAAKLSDGSSTVAHVTWTSTGGSVDANGVYTGGTAGTHRVIAKSTYSNLADTAIVTVSGSAPAPASISISPSSVTLRSGATQRFVASGKSSAGTPVDPSVTWTATGGTIASDGVYTAGSAAGTYRVVATHESRLMATATVTITAPSEPSPSIAGCPSSGYRRVVNVASSYTLANALNTAQPGDQIQLAPGTYSGTVSINRRGTATDSITLCGPATAIVAGAVHVTDASYWRLQGFQVKGGWIGLQVRRSTNNRISGLEIHSVGYSGIKLTEGSSRNVVTGNWIHHTGKTAPQYGEGIYVGEGQSSATSAQRVADYNLIEGNRFGPYVTAEHFDVKLGTQGNVVRGNSLDATGFKLIWTNGLVAALGIVDGSNQRVEANTVANLTYSDPSNWGVFRTYAGSGTVVTGNVVVGPVSARRFYDRDHASSTVVKCDNVKPSALAWGTTCAP